MNKIAQRLLMAIVAITMILPLTTSCSKISEMFSSKKEENTVETDTEFSHIEGNEVSSSLSAIIDPNSEVRGIYISTAFNLQFPSKADLSAAELKKELDEIIATCQSVGLNTIYFQVRPSCDALYKSSLFPVSQYLFTNGVLSFDPLEYLIEKAHKNNIYVHAWINPLRVTTGSASNPLTDTSKLQDGNPVKTHPGWAVAYADGRLYLNPGIPEVRDYIASGVSEIVQNYNVDGVIFDDYFYPYPVRKDGKNVAFDDSACYAKYGEDMTLEDWRRENINLLVQSCYFAVKNISENVQFGVAPFGIWKNDNGTNGGTPTKGLESYSETYCDPTAWVQGGYVDYLAPQIYWQFDSTVAPYAEIVRWWNELLDGRNINLLISHAAYHYAEDDWENPDGEIEQQVQFARSELTYRGSIFYGYNEIKQNAQGIKEEISSLYGNEVIYSSPLSTGYGAGVSTPANGSTVNSAKTYLIGYSDPTQILTMNGEKVGRTRNGFFSVYVSLKEGKNTFTFEQNGTTYTHTVYRPTTSSTGTTSTSTSAKSPAEMKEFSVTNVTPSQNILSEGGKTITVSCTAPAGSTVKVSLGTSTVTLKQSDSTKAQTDKWLEAKYTGTVTLPSVSANEIKTLGELIFTATQGKNTATAKGASVRIRGTNAYIPIVVLYDDTELKISETSTYYEDFSIQSSGMRDYAISQANGFYKLRVGGYVYENTVEELPAGTEIPIATLSEITITADAENTYIKIATDQNIPYNGTITDGAFRLTLYNVKVKSAPDTVNLSKNPLFTNVEYSYPAKTNCLRLNCTVVDTKNFYGFNVEYKDGCMLVTFRNPTKIDTNSKKPLTGIRIVLDAGHGGKDPGTLGALNTDEKKLNLSIALTAKSALENLGATVTMTRTNDEYIATMDRAYSFCDINPDLVVSIHQNAIDYSVNPTSVAGTLGLWWADSGVLLSECVTNAVADALHFPNLNTRQQMLAVCRNPKFPSALVEVCFMTNVEEYEKMISGGMEEAGNAIAQGILNYFKIQQQWILK